MKPQFAFYFEDEPQYRAVDQRAYTASLLRSYRKRPHQFVLRRAGLHHYRVTLLLSPSRLVAVLKTEG